MKTVLVTGANGFVGRHLCSLLLSEGFQVKGCTRKIESFQQLPAGVEPICTGPLEKYEDWPFALQNVCAVVHLAARTHVMKEKAADPLAEYRRTNVLATEKLAAAIPNSRVKRLIFLSSIKAVGEGCDHAYAETESCRPEDAYGVTKREAEELLLRAAAGASWEPVVIRPPLVYGPGVVGNFRRLLSAVQRGWPLPLGSIRNQRDMIYVGNLCSAIATSIAHPKAGGNIFHVSDGHPLSTCSLVQQMGVVVGKKARVIPVPVSVLKGLGAVCGKQAEVSRLVNSLTLNTSAIQHMLNWAPPFSVSEGLQQTIQPR